MIQALPRYCPRCGAPTLTDMQRCAICDLTVEALLHCADTTQFDRGEDHDPALQSTLAPTPGHFQQEDEEVLPDCQHGCNPPDEFAQPPHVSPASPLPPETGEWNALNHQESQLHCSAQQEPHFLPDPPLPGEPWQDPDLASSPDTLAILSVEALLRCANITQFETSEDHDPALQSTPAPTPRLFQQEGEELLPDCQHGCNPPGEFVQPPHVSPAAPLPPETGERNAPVVRWRAGIAFIILVALLIFASSGYIVFSDHWSSRNNSQTMLKTTSINSAINAPATAIATAKAATNPYVSGGTLIFSDTLKAVNSNWDQNTNCAFKGGSYHVTAVTIQSCPLNANVTLTNFVLEVKVTLLQGDVAGLFFRENKLYNKSNAYLLDFDSMGNYQIWNYSASSDAQLIDYGVTSALRTGYNQTNIIALVVQGSSITLYVNGQMVKHFIDSTYSSGGLSLMSSEYAPYTGTSEATYSDLRLWQL